MVADIGEAEPDTPPPPIQGVDRSRNLTEADGPVPVPPEREQPEPEPTVRSGG